MTKTTCPKCGKTGAASRLKKHLAEHLDPLQRRLDRDADRAAVERERGSFDIRENAVTGEVRGHWRQPDGAGSMVITLTQSRSGEWIAVSPNGQRLRGGSKEEAVEKVLLSIGEKAWGRLSKEPVGLAGKTTESRTREGVAVSSLEDWNERMKAREEAIAGKTTESRTREGEEVSSLDDWNDRMNAREIGLRAKGKETHWKGDLAVYTGKTEFKYGKTWYEVEVLEGHMKGERKVTQYGPDETPGRALSPPPGKGPTPQLAHGPTIPAPRTGPTFSEILPFIEHLVDKIYEDGWKGPIPFERMYDALREFTGLDELAIPVFQEALQVGAKRLRLDLQVAADPSRLTERQRSLAIATDHGAIYYVSRRRPG